MPTKLRGAPVVRNLANADVVFTVAEVAKLLKVSKAKVYTMVDRGELEHFRVGTVMRVGREALEAFMATASDSALTLSKPSKPSPRKDYP